MLKKKKPWDQFALQYTLLPVSHCSKLAPYRPTLLDQPSWTNFVLFLFPFFIPFHFLFSFLRYFLFSFPLFFPFSSFFFLLFVFFLSFLRFSFFLLCMFPFSFLFSFPIFPFLFCYIHIGNTSKTVYLKSWCNIKIFKNFAQRSKLGKILGSSSDSDSGKGAPLRSTQTPVSIPTPKPCVENPGREQRHTHPQNRLRANWMRDTD